MARKTHDEIEALKKKLNTSRIWSFSRVNAFINCNYAYYMKYVKFEKEKESSIYSMLGGAFHDILEDFYNGKLKYEQMIDEAEIAIMKVSVLDMKFDKNDNGKNEGIETKYFECIKHFFANHIPVKEKVLTEKDVVIKMGNHYFNGYIDAIHKENDTYIITDYKSSTIYAGKKIHQEGRQLMLYALGLHQQGIPLDKIRIRWNFLKYNSLTFTQKNEKVKTMNAERNAWAGKLKSQLRMNLKDTKSPTGEQSYTDEQIEDLLTQCMDLNSISILPQSIQDKYEISDCYVDIPINKEILDNLEQEFVATIINIYRKEKEYEVTKDIKMWKKEVDMSSYYFCSNICGYTAGQCPCYREFLNNMDIFKTEENKRVKTKEEDTTDSDWLRELGLI